MESVSMEDVRVPALEPFLVEQVVRRVQRVKVEPEVGGRAEKDRITVI